METREHIRGCVSSSIKNKKKKKKEKKVQQVGTGINVYLGDSNTPSAWLESWIKQVQLAPAACAQVSWAPVSDMGDLQSSQFIVLAWPTLAGVST